MREKQKHYLIASVGLIIAVIITLFVMLEEEIVLHELNQGMIVFLVVLVYIVGTVWVMLHHRARFNHYK